MDTYAVDHNLPCKNRACPSFGHVHPNCKCFAHGGCITAHDASCEHYASGGKVKPHNVQRSIGHAVLHFGLGGLLKHTGKPKMSDPDSHHKTIEKAKSHLSENEVDKASNVLHGSPVGGPAGKLDLKEIVEHLAPAISSKESHPEGMRSSVDYFSGAMKGKQILEDHSKKTLGKEKLSVESDKGSIDKLKEFLNEVQENPTIQLDVAGHLGHYSPDDAAAVGALTATATDYLNSLKPPSAQPGPLEAPIPPDRVAMQQWDRQLEIAEKPQLVFQHVKDGTLQPQDLVTLGTLYPALNQEIMEKATELLIDAKDENKDIPYSQRQSLSLLLNQPLDGTMTQSSMQAIMMSQGPQQAQNQQKNSMAQKNPTEVEMKQISKVDALSETGLEARQIHKIMK